MDQQSIKYSAHPDLETILLISELPEHELTVVYLSCAFEMASRLISYIFPTHTLVLRLCVGCIAINYFYNELIYRICHCNNMLGLSLIKCTAVTVLERNNLGDK